VPLTHGTPSAWVPAAICGMTEIDIAEPERACRGT
jgi:hypothetical protein